MSPSVPTSRGSRGRPSERLIRVAAGVVIALVSLTGFVVLGVIEQAAAQEAGGSTSDDFLTPGIDASNVEPERIKYEGPDGTMSLPNGGVVDLSDDLMLQVWVDPYPPSTFDLDVELRLTDANGDTINDATVTADWDMVFMWHGPFVAEFDATSDGRYISRFELFMFGPWELVIHTSAPGYEQPQDLSISIFVWPE